MRTNPLNSNDGNKQDYRDILVAKITAKHIPFAGPFANRPVYEWIEQQIGQQGEDESAPSPRQGTYTSPLNFDNILVDINDTELTTEDIQAGYYTWIRMKGEVEGSTVYESAMTPPTGNIPTTSGCTPPGTDAEECLEFYVSDAVGRCAAIETETISASLSGGWWEASSTITTAAGEGTLKYRIIPTGTQIPGYPEMKITVGVTDYPGTPAGCDSDGRTRFIFGGSSLCGGTVNTQTCANSFSAAIGCIPCPIPDPCLGWYCCAQTNTVAYIETCEDLDDFCQDVPGGPGPGGTGLDCTSTSPQTQVAVTYSNTISCLEGTSVIHNLFPSASLPRVWTTSMPATCPEECESDFAFTCSTATTDAMLQVFGASWELVSFVADPFRAVFRLAADTPCAFGAETVVPEGSTAVVTLVGAGTVLGPFATEAEAIAVCTDDPVCDATACPDGASQEYTVTLSGGTGDYAQLNGTWTISHVSGDIWVGVLGSCTVTFDAITKTGTFTAPGLSSILKMEPSGGGDFNCCSATTMITVDGETPGVGDKPSISDLTPSGACSCAPSGAICCDDTGEPLEGHPSLNLNVPDSAYAGDYTLIFDTDHYQSAEFEYVGDDYYWKLTCSGTVWTLELYQNGVLYRDGTDDPGLCPDPFELTFSGADFDGMGDLTVDIL